MIHATCSRHGGGAGFTNVVVSKRERQIELDPHADESCVLTLDEDAATQLRDALGEAKVSGEDNSPCPLQTTDEESPTQLSDPFVDAYRRLKAYVAEGHTREHVTEFAQQLNRELPQDNDIATAMVKIRAIGAVVRDLNGGTDE